MGINEAAGDRLVSKDVTRVRDARCVPYLFLELMQCRFVLGLLVHGAAVIVGM
jgi:hypothetical protein